MSNNSIKHHFVPEFYQKGFLSDDGHLYAYKKTYNSLKRWSPSQVFYAKELHTISIKNDTTLMIEEFYSGIEGEFSKYFKIVKENINNKRLLIELIRNNHFIMMTKLLVATQFWRTPCKKQLAIEYSSRLLNFYDECDDEIKKILRYDRKFIKFISKRAKKDYAIKLIQFFLLPLLSFDISKRAIRINFLKAPKDKVFFSSDRPVVYKDIEELFSFKSFLFPFSKYILILGSNTDTKRLNINDVNMLIMDKSLETVISGSKEQLNEIKSKRIVYRKASTAYK